MTVLPKRFRGAYITVGQGRPVLALAGLGCANWIFDEMTENLADCARFILPDNRGMGRSPRATGEYEVEDLARDALALMDDLGIRQFTLLGISMGGFIAQSLIQLAPERVNALILMCTTGPGSDFVPLPCLSDVLLEASYSVAPEKRVHISTESTTFPGLKQRDPGLFEKISAKKLRHMAELDQLKFQNTAATRFTEGNMDYSRFRCPSLILSGANDRFVAVENARILSRKIKGSGLAIFPETDHLFFLEKPEPVAAEIRDFLESL